MRPPPQRHRSCGKLLDMEFICYHRDRVASGALRRELLENHLTYMDQYSQEMIARGPTSSGDVFTGSCHAVALPSLEAARSFAFDEPNYQAGVYRDVLLRRWINVLGRTMWDFPGGRTGGNRYLVLGFGSGENIDTDRPAHDDDVIAYGPMLSDDGEAWLGTAAMVRAADDAAAASVLPPLRYDDVEVRSWRFGGRA